jgi:phosphoribosylaminoimidazole-succinocarboxamide synthase
MPHMGAALEIAGASHLHSGKVRDLYDLGDGRLLMVATDRISAFDHVLPTPIPDKGKILTKMSTWWFDKLADVVPNHLISTDVPAEVEDRAVVCEQLQMFAIECVARGYLAGSAVRDYDETGVVCGIELPPHLENGSRLPEPIFTPATKAAIGEHDENIPYPAVVDIVGEDIAAKLRALTLEVYAQAEAIARERGIIVADTKLEFGARADGTIVLADEVLTPDSSRFWPVDEWQPGREQPSFDKQFVRSWLTSDAGWDPASGAAPPVLPPEIVELTRDRYAEAYHRLTGQSVQRTQEA